MIAAHEWGDPGAPAVVCLHGVTNHGRHFARLAQRLGERYRVVALDLRGHGASTWEPPWHLEQHVADVVAAVEERGLERASWVGHSFGGRIAYEVAAARPQLVERLALLDPAIRIDRTVALYAAENARKERAYATFAEAVDRRYEESALHLAPRELLEEELRLHLEEGDDGRFRYRYCQSAVVAAYGEMSREPPPFERVRIPTLVLLGERSYLPYDDLLGPHGAALGELLEVVRVPGGHTVLWDALDDTAAAIERFLA
ncbi:MAG TPA: alpha/beta hydrolase [Gaiellaceae bacterium]|nr:alpha/beta hydrolase [Gaiellaceae bacterium]